MNRGLYTLKDVLESGVSRTQLEKLVASGAMTRVGYGWYARESADPNFITAARAGTRLGCVTACAAHGIWMPSNNTELHVLAGLGESVEAVESRVFSASKGLHTPIVHRATGPKSQLVCPVDEAIEQVAKHHETEIALIAIESALNMKLVDIRWVSAMLERLSQRQRMALEDFSFASESGSETRVAHSMRKRGLTVHQQVPLFPNRHHRVDIVVGKSWVIECDSAMHHSAIKKYELDRDRDLYLESHGFRVTRLSYRQIWQEWESTQQQFNSIIMQRAYRKPAGLDPAQVTSR